MLLLLFLLRSALAGGDSVDVELLPLTFSPRDLPGVDSPVIEGWGAMRVGLLYHYEHEPLVLYDWQGEQIGAVISARSTTAFGLSADLNRVVGVRLAMPVAMQDGEDATGLTAEGIGVGDAWVGVRVSPLQRPHGAVGVSADLAIPTGTNEAWLGEASPRLDLGLNALGRLGPAEALVHLGWRHRKSFDTDLSLQFGDEAAGAVGVRVNILDGRVAPFVLALGRHTLGTPLTRSAANPAEALVGIQSQLLPWLRLEAFAGQGLNDGYGTPVWRVGGGLRLGTPAKPPEVKVPPEVTVSQLVDRETGGVSVTELVEAPDPEPEAHPWAPGVLARLEQSQITIRDPIQFEFGTARILPESLPTLQAVAAIMGEHVEIGEIVIEGHASEEGSFIYNYDLAFRRSIAVFQALVEAGVHPYRLSVRSMGEVVPKAAGEDEVSLAENRRVEFHIVHTWRPEEEVPELGTEIRRPWDGAQASVTPSGRAAATPQPPPPPPPDPDLVNPDEFAAPVEENTP